MSDKAKFQNLIRICRAIGAIIPAYCRSAGLALLLVGALAMPSLAAADDSSRFRPGLRNGPEPNKLNTEQLDKILDSLRRKTGFLELRFDEAGFLSLGDRNSIDGGSATARALLVAAVDGVKAVQLVSRHSSSEVAFARLAGSVIYKCAQTGARLEAQSLELDFSDFAQLQGDQEVIAAFDPGLAVLHELAHAVLALRDDKTSAYGLGECEGYINRIRRELGLPERQHYIARVRESVQAGAKVKLSEVLFIQQGQAKKKRFYLSWESEKVGRIT